MAPLELMGFVTRYSLGPIERRVQGVFRLESGEIGWSSARKDITGK